MNPRIQRPFKHGTDGTAGQDQYWRGFAPSKPNAWAQELRRQYPSYSEIDLSAGHPNTAPKKALSRCPGNPAKDRGLSAFGQNRVLTNPADNNSLAQSALLASVINGLIITVYLPFCSSFLIFFFLFFYVRSLYLASFRHDCVQYERRKNAEIHRDRRVFGQSGEQFEQFFTKTV